MVRRLKTTHVDRIVDHCCCAVWAARGADAWLIVVLLMCGGVWVTWCMVYGVWRSVVGSGSGSGSEGSGGAAADC